MATEMTSASAVEGNGEASGLLKNAFVGNVSRHTPLSAEHKKSTKRGNLQFDACFEGGKRLPPSQPLPSFLYIIITVTAVLSKILRQVFSCAVQETWDVWTASPTTNTICSLDQTPATQGH